MKKLRLLEAVEATSTTRVPSQRSYSEIYQQCEAAGVNVAAVVYRGRSLDGRRQTGYPGIGMH